MAEFVGVATTQLSVSNMAGSPVPIQMPTGILAGDWLVVAGGTFSLATWDHSSGDGWFAINGPRNIMVKIADGSEDGATLTNFVTLNTETLFEGPATRAAVFAAFAYRFPVAPTSGGGFGPSSAVHPYSPRLFPFPTPTNPADSSDDAGGTFPGFVTNASEFRFLMGQGQGDVGSGATVLSSMTWHGDLIQDRTGMVSQGPSVSYDATSATWADQFYLSNSVNPDPDTGLIIAGSAQITGNLNGFSLIFPVVIVSDYWGILNP